jgi:hypothetical protein
MDEKEGECLSTLLHILEREGRGKIKYAAHNPYLDGGGKFKK